MSLVTREIPKEAWSEYFSFISSTLPGKEVSVEALGYNLGAQQDGEHCKIHGITYDEERNVVHVDTESLGHPITDPALIRVEEEGVILKLIEITQTNGDRRIIKLESVTALPMDQNRFSEGASSALL